jgi:hypothetical protein
MTGEGDDCVTASISKKGESLGCVGPQFFRLGIVIFCRGVKLKIYRKLAHA